MSTSNFLPSPPQRRLLDYLHENPQTHSALALCQGAGISRTSYYRWCRDSAFCVWLGSAWASRMLVDGAHLINMARANAPSKFSYWKALFELTFDPKALGLLAKWSESLGHLTPGAFLPAPARPAPEPSSPQSSWPSEEEWNRRVAAMHPELQQPPAAPPPALAPSAPPAHDQPKHISRQLFRELQRSNPSVSLFRNPPKNTPGASLYPRATRHLSTNQQLAPTPGYSFVPAIETGPAARRLLPAHLARAIHRSLRPLGSASHRRHAAPRARRPPVPPRGGLPPLDTSAPAPVLCKNAFAVVPGAKVIAKARQRGSCYTSFCCRGFCVGSVPRLRLRFGADSQKSRTELLSSGLGAAPSGDAFAGRSRRRGCSGIRFGSCSRDESLLHSEGFRGRRPDANPTPLETAPRGHCRPRKLATGSKVDNWIEYVR